ncbi:MAG: hypothetical protein KME50_32595 [Nostoc desertorum CM1-VF14]|jgi:hypothetical protein|nr:hypothetical protein [Nostoc desertorum CM1-VF14]
MDWEELYQNWLSQRNADNDNLRLDLERQARTVIQNQKLADVTWHIQALEGQTPVEQNKRLFIVNVLRKGNQMPQLLFLPMLRTAVYEKNPSYNRSFLEPCMRCFGSRLVNSELISRYTENGTDYEKAGVANAFYWSFGLNGHGDIPREHIDDLRQKVQYWFLTEFVANKNINVRRSIVAQLQLNPFKYPTKLSLQVLKAIYIGWIHPDQYIHNRIKIQLGLERSYMALPQRNST